MDKLFGLPAHPLLVHLPVVLLPLAVVGALLAMVRPSWLHALRWPTLALAVAGTLGAILSAASGEELEDLIGAKEGPGFAQEIHEHAEAGELARNLAILFLVALAVYVLVPWWRSRRERSVLHSSSSTSDAGARSIAGLPVAASDWFGARWATWVARVVVLAAGALVVWAIIRAGHTGAWQHWHDLLDSRA